MTLRRSLMAFTALASFTMSEGAYAQQLAIEEITVTSRKREENLQSMPLTVTALTSDDIYERGVSDLLDLADYTPGFYTESVAGRGSNPYFRGLVVNTGLVDRQNSSVFVDGYYVLGTAATFGFNNIERVEVLKGPQSALFGRATFGGAVNYITKTPTDEFQADVDVDIAEHNRYDAAVTVSGPLFGSDTLKGLLSARYYEFGGEWTNTAQGENGATVGQEETKAISGKLLWDPTESLAITVSASYAEDDDGAPPTTSLPSSLDNCLFYNSTTPLGYICGKLPEFDTVKQNNQRVAERFGMEVGQLQISERYTADANYTTSNDWGFELRGGLNKQSVESIVDASYDDSIGLSNGLGGTGGLVFGSTGSVEANRSTTEFQDKSIQFKVTAPNSETITAFAGVSYYEHDILDRNLRLTAGRPFGQVGSSRHIDNYSVFGSITYNINEQFAIGFDGRYQEDKVRESTAEFAPQTLADVPTNASNEGIAAFAFDTASFKRFLPRVILDYKPNDDVTLYGVLSRGNKPGFFNNAVVSANLGVAPEVLEETAWNYELGAKTLWLDGRLLVNVAAYYIDWTNQQIRQTFLDAQGQDSTISTNAGATEVYGVELESTFVATENLTFSGSVAYADPEFKTFLEPTFAPQLGVPSDLAGNEPYRYPDWQIQIGADFVQPDVMNDWDFFARADMNMTGKRWSEIYNLSYIGWEYKLNLRTGIQDDNWKLTAYVNNVLDDRSLAGSFRFRDLRRFTRFDQTDNSFSFPYAQLANLNRGRNFGVNISYSY